VAEDAGIILPIGQWATDMACGQARHWRGSQSGAAWISINVSGRQFAQPGLVADLQRALDRTGVDPRSLILEITESVVLEDVRLTRRILNQVKALGIRIAIDDFGTGVSSLGQLRRYPVDLLKIDRSFVSGKSLKGSDIAIISTILELGRRLGIEVIAEGVETSEQEALLTSLDCRYVQGYHYSPPLEASDVDGFVEGFKRARNQKDPPGRSGRLSA
jgi:EAL domain-containing protein (putative c-di-GMP-specific phosphodiesterase class I)